MPAIAVIAALAFGALGTSAAEAKPVKPGGVPGVTGVATWHSGTTYDVAATWGSVTGATSYRAAIIKGSTTLAAKTLTGLSWDPTITTGPGPVTLQVQAVVNHRKGSPTKVTVSLPDEVAPTGTFVSSKNDATKLGTITQTALYDDAGSAGITRTVYWGDGSPTVTWGPGSTQITHTYTTIGRYVPVVTLTDASDNSAPYTLDAIVLGDVTAPTGSVAVSPSSGWAAYTQVEATPTAVSDDVSPSNMIKVQVSWGDGTTSDSTGTAVLKHVYAAAGTYAVATTITDEAGNPTVLPSSVTMTSDKVGPRVTLTLPAKKHSVRAWKTLRGKATDAQTGVKTVSLKAVEKRGSVWYGYNASTQKWVKAATKAKAYARSVAFSRRTDPQNRWSAKLVGLRKGTLVYKVKAVDRVGNASATVTHKATLTSA
jgi:hypothetical protein